MITCDGEAFSPQSCISIMSQGYPDPQARKGKDTLFKYITYEERLEIENRLTRNENLSKIGEAIGRNRTSVSREIQKYVQPEEYSKFGSVYNPCLHRSKCKN